MIDDITPVILTYNESPNIRRTLEQLNWAKEIIVVDSFSSDDTVQIISGFSQIRVFRRKFDSHSCQWNFAIKETGISTEWVLALDADYILTNELIEELKALDPDKATGGYKACFIYCVYGQRLRGTVYPPVTVLFRLDSAIYVQDGHTQRIQVDGNILLLRYPVLHDDRKSLSHWLASQDRYMQLEVRKLSQADWKEIGWADRLRKMRVVFPFLIFFYCLFAKGAVLDGRAGLYYSFQRMLAELILSIRLIEHDFKRLDERG